MPCIRGRWRWWWLVGPPEVIDRWSGVRWRHHACWGGCSRGACGDRCVRKGGEPEFFVCMRQQWSSSNSVRKRLRARVTAQVSENTNMTSIDWGYSRSNASWAVHGSRRKGRPSADRHGRISVSKLALAPAMLSLTLRVPSSTTCFSANPSTTHPILFPGWTQVCPSCPNGPMHKGNTNDASMTICWKVEGSRGLWATMDGRFRDGSQSSGICGWLRGISGVITERGSEG